MRAVTLGLLLGLVIAGTTYFNDQVIRQTYLIGNHLPASVFGLWLVLLLVVNPLLRRGRAAWALGTGEMAIILALGLAVCGWPGSNLFRYFSGMVSKPAVILPTESVWQSQRVMSYLPGGSPMLAEGFIADYPAVVDRLRAGLRGEGDPAVRRVASLLTPAERHLVETIPPNRSLAAGQRRDLVEAFNRLLMDPGFYEPAAWGGVPLPEGLAERIAAAADDGDTDALVRANRELLQATFPGLVRPAPQGEGVLLDNGRRHPVATDQILAGRESEALAGPGVVPWGVWWPTIRLWIGVALLLAIASYCLVIIVHPQWTQRELLPYPTARFVEEVATPATTRDRLFWIGLAAAFAMHLMNGLNVWFTDVTLPHFPQRLDFTALGTLFPNASRANGSWQLWTPLISLTVVGFGFFIPTRVSFSLGISYWAWIALGAWMMTFGRRLEDGHFNLGANGNALRFGAYLGLTLLIVYFGRRYYAQVAKASIGLARAEMVPRASVWAARLLVGTLAAAVAMLVGYGGLTVLMAVLLVLVILMILLVLTRVNVETGLFYAQPDFLPVVIIGAIFGLHGVGPETLLVLTIASAVLIADPREAVTPYLANALRISQTVGHVRPSRAAGPIGVSLVLGLVVALVATLTIQYNVGLNPLDTFSNRLLPTSTFDVTADALAELSAHNEIGASTGLTSLGQLAHMDPVPGMIPWTLAGVALVLGCSLARLRLPWWPIHPVLFVIWGTYPGDSFAFSFLLASLVKGTAVRLGGVKAYHKLKPLMVGLIAGEVLAVVVWSVVGTIYYLSTDLTPPTYRVFPV